MAGIGKFAGYKGWKKKGKGYYVMFVKNIKVAEARTTRMGKKVKATAKVKIGDIDDIWEEMKGSEHEATAWLNERRREITKKVFG
jgi:hypothetical protein